jgi:pyruvate,orthophosphate dikinase
MQSELAEDVMSAQWVYRFDEGNASMKDLLGGKGANLAEMSRMGLPVPPGFIITTEACKAYYKSGKELPEGLLDQIAAALADLEAATGKRLGDPQHPLLLSVRSGAKFSMPGMMDTVLNLGLNPSTLAGLITASEDARFGQDAYRRFIAMFSDIVLGVPKGQFEHILAQQKAKAGVQLDAELSAADLEAVAQASLALVRAETGQDFPEDPRQQLEAAVRAVFQSWGNDRAVVYRTREHISEDLGTAVNIQAMVFGNLGADSGSGVAFTRDPATGEKLLYGEYLMNAQGEDVVAGVRTPLAIHDLKTENPRVYAEFVELCQRLEARYHEMMDVEFTIERGRLFMLQCRVGKRTGPAAVRIAVEMADEGLIDQTEAIRRVGPDQLDQLLHPRIDPADLKTRAALARGIAASPGAAVGQLVFDANTAEAAGKVKRPVLLVREETSPDDVHGMLGAKGILTSRGGKTSHAAVVARGFGIPCVVGCEALQVDAEAKTLTVNGQIFKENEWLTIDGTTGQVFGEKLTLIAPTVGGELARLMSWCDQVRRLHVRANADNPRDARQAVAFGAEGIGLCRTEHMFFETDRLPIVRAMILASTEDQRHAALQKLETVQQSDFEGIFEAMAGRPVTIRLLDPPLHEFLPPHDELLQQVTELRLAHHMTGGHALAAVLAEKEAMLAAVNGMREQNPMLGLRGVRLSLLMPGIAEMQTRAIVQAALKERRRGVPVEVEIMVPLVGFPEELARVRAVVERVAAEVVAEVSAEPLAIKIGTMIEVPRAALQAGPIAKYADFFSFGTNDLTQMTLGVSRDDAGRFLKQYVTDKILADDPFDTLDTVGVGRLMQLAVAEGRQAKPGLKCGICGEHGGDPRSITFCHQIGLDYVSCSPFRVPTARLAAAQAALAGHEDATR